MVLLTIFVCDGNITKYNKIKNGRNRSHGQFVFLGITLSNTKNYINIIIGHKVCQSTDRRH